jgi:hypothetical protein
MNCKTALELISRDREPDSDVGSRSQLEAHLATCESCRQTQSRLAATLDSWRSEAAGAAVPDPAREWSTLRRRLRESSAATPARPIAGRPIQWAWLAIPAAAALVALAILRPPFGPGDEPAASPAMSAVAARADAVEAPGGNASTMVFVDDRSGWLIVWASDSGGRSG